jgi:hypothetical protein
MPRSTPAATPAATPSDPRLRRRRARSAAQLDLFPEAVDVRPLDVHAVAGARTRVRGVWQVRFERDATTHRVFADRHGWYCELHGPACRAALAARRAAEAASSVGA